MLLASVALGQDGPCHLVSNVVQLLVGQLAVFGLDSQPVTMQANLLLEPIRNGLLDFLLLEFDESACGWRQRSRILCWSAGIASNVFIELLRVYVNGVN